MKHFCLSSWHYYSVAAGKSNLPGNTVMVIIYLVATFSQLKNGKEEKIKNVTPKKVKKSVDTF